MVGLLMDLGHELAEILPELQAAAESMMVDACVITREGEGWTIDPATGREVPAPPVTIYEGRCKVWGYDQHERVSQVGEMTEVLDRKLVQVPVSAGPFQIGDKVTVFARGNRPDRHYRVALPDEKSWQKAQDLVVEGGASD